MRPIQPYRRRSSASFWWGMLLLLMMAGGGVVGLLWMLGVNLNPFAGPADDPYMVRIPINSLPIPAYERVTREHLLNPTTGGLMFQRVPPASAVGMSIVGIAADGSHVEGRVEAVRRDHDDVVFVVAGGQELPQSQTMQLGGALMNVNSIIGRVVKKDKRVGLGFQESTFFPQGTPEGIAGATPPGWRAVTLDATKLTGVHALNAGDRIDLMASVPTTDLGAYQSAPSGTPASPSVVGNVLAGGGGARGAEAPVEPLLIAQNALVLKPVYVRNEATTSSSLTQGKRVQNVPKYEVAIGVQPEDVIPLQSALNKGLAITCVAHSMQPVTGEEATLADKSVASDREQRVPVTVRAILAYDVVGREAFVSPATRRLRMEPVSQQEIDRQGIITSVEEALGAVARHDIPKGCALRRSDLLSGPLQPARRCEATGTSVRSEKELTADVPGAFSWRWTSSRSRQASEQKPGELLTRPTTVGDLLAVTRIIPPGYTAFALPWNRLYGAEHLQIGDELDLFASYSLESENQEEETETRPDGTTVVRKKYDLATRTTTRTLEESLGFRGEPWFVATSAIVVGPVGFPAPASALRALGPQSQRPASGGDATILSGPVLLIAVDDRDVESLATAVATKRVVFTVAFHAAERSAVTDSTCKQIALAPQDIAAFEMLSESAWNGNRRRPLARTVHQDDQRFANALTVEQLRGMEYRVLRQAKRRGEFFTEADFLPLGTGPGVAAAAKTGETIFAVADREIEGLDTFQTDDRVAILVRRVVEPPQGVTLHGFSLKRPVSAVVVPAARIVRPSRAGQTILAVPNQDLTRLQATWAASPTRANSQDNQRSHLLAVALPREADHAEENLTRLAGGFSDTDSEIVQASALRNRADTESIPAFDPVENVRLLQAIVGRQHEWHAFEGATAGPSAAPAIPALRLVR